MRSRVQLPIVVRQIAHNWFNDFKKLPFNQALGDGTLPRAVFEDFLVQDACYLRAYAGAMRHLIQKAPDAETKKKLKEIAEAMVDEELKQIDGYTGSYLTMFSGVKPVQEVCAYSHHLRRAVQTGYAEGIAGLSVCPWAYERMGRHMRADELCHDHHYREVIKTYSKPSYRKANDDMKILLTRCFDHVSHDYAAQARLTDWFCGSLHHERFFTLRMGRALNQDLVESYGYRH